MVRLTKRQSDGSVIAWHPLKYYNYDDFKKVLERLAYYEDLEEQGKLVKLPYDYGTFVKVKTKQSGSVDYGTVAAYTVMDDGLCVWVSGYRQSWSGEYLPENIEPMSKHEIEELKRSRKLLSEVQQNV